MDWACLSAAVVVGIAAGYMFHSVRVRMMSQREKQELEALKVRTRELQATITQVCKLVDDWDLQSRKRSIAGTLPRPPQY